MYDIRAPWNLLFWLLILTLFIFIKVFIAVCFLSVLIVPLTWIYSKIAGQSYYFTIDQSQILYKLNKIGQWSIVIAIAILLYNMI